MPDPLQDLTAAGVSIWLDDLSRQLLTTGALNRLVEDRHVVGITSNPTIFANAIGGSADYTDQIRELGRRGTPTAEVLRLLTVADVRGACDVLRPVYDATDSVDGRVSIEVDPRLAHDADQAIAQARQLWRLVDRPNLFVKIPATQAGLPRHRTVSGGRDQHQRHLDLLPAALRRRDRGVSRRHGTRPHRRTQPVHPHLCGIVLRQPSRHRNRQAHRPDRHPAGASAEGESCDRERQAGVRTVRAGFRR
jgi:Transaldolase/Fructose-6-phosphate aldolase